MVGVMVGVKIGRDLRRRAVSTLPGALIVGRCRALPSLATPSVKPSGRAKPARCVSALGWGWGGTRSRFGVAWGGGRCTRLCRPLPGVVFVALERRRRLMVDAGLGEFDDASMTLGGFR